MKSLGALLLLLWLAAPEPLRAHAYLVKSVPAQRAVLHRAPARIELWFNERLEPRYSFFTVVDADGRPIEPITGGVDQKNAKVMSAPVTQLGAGQYVVKYRVLSVDGHIVQDQFPFTIKR